MPLHIHTEAEMDAATDKIEQLADEAYQLRQFIGVIVGECDDCNTPEMEIGFDGEACICLDRKACAARKTFK